ncbi:hypothetical protein LSUE1_G000401 [Lachnellula suecica]|uniref:Inheritance of peroxisomes protein 1 n=1 Tax=Lachnellula suecica TaxID=602035 RepID=A0A8T9CFP5_9HELO|nr:hypothetical protein LSUE1_G000401 [Lachnellula suecica]
MPINALPSSVDPGPLFQCPLSIYRAPGSVAFLSCAKALQPILPKSQAWCVDGNSKFVLQIRRPQYWRIEIPNQTAEEKTRVEELKQTLSKVLLFEKTPCPFERTFVVELPEAPQTPVKKRPWKPVERQQTGRLPSPESNIREDGYRASSLQNLHSKPVAVSTAGNDIPVVPESQPSYTGSPSHVISTSPVEFDSSLPEYFPSEEETKLSRNPLGLAVSFEHRDAIAIPGRDIGQEMVEEDDFSDATDDTNITPRSQFQPKYQPLVYEQDSDSIPFALQNSNRSITAPPVLSLVTSPPSKQPTESPLRRSTTADSESGFSSSVDSFHSVQSWHSPLNPPSPQTSDPSSPKTYPYPHHEIILPKRAHKRDTSELTIAPKTPETPGVWGTAVCESEARDISPPKTPTLITDAGERSDDESDRPEAITPPTVRPDIRHRATTRRSSCRELSPLPAAVNLFSPPRRRTRRLQTARHLPVAIIQTTCKILLSPPSHLLHLMLNIASKIAAGEWRGFLSNRGENVYWDFEQEYGVNTSNEDDYGPSQYPKPRAPKGNATTSGADVGGSWEVD